jgi:DNA-binding HxlR family transcriptional regulator
MKKMTPDCCRSVCPLTNALDIFGDKWTLLIIRDMLMRGRHEFHEFLAGEEKIATNILSNRLKNLLCMGIIEYVRHPDHKSKKLYYLTQKGKDLIPVIMEIVLWSEAYHELPDIVVSKVKIMRQNPKKYMQKLLKDLNEWEKKNLKK